MIEDKEKKIIDKDFLKLSFNKLTQIWRLKLTMTIATNKVKCNYDKNNSISFKRTEANKLAEKLI